MAEPDKDPFYVGYLPLPRPIKRFLVPWLMGNIVLAIGIAAVLAQQHRAPGDGTWETGQAVSIEGVLTIDPYPLLRTDTKTFVLVEQGKHGTQQRLSRESIKPGAVLATGFVIERDERTVLELDGSMDKPIEAVALPRMTLRHPTEDLGLHTLRGEIVDPKCYLGVMRPGDGKTHKTCATLCITGGIPPMFVVRDRQGNTAAYLLTDAEGRAFPESHYGYIADPIELTGRVLREGDLLIFRAELSTIKRLGAGR